LLINEIALGKVVSTTLSGRDSERPSLEDPWSNHEALWGRKTPTAGRSKFGIGSSPRLGEVSCRCGKRFRGSGSADQADIRRLESSLLAVLGFSWAGSL
jgi:hypothetical protein